LLSSLCRNEVEEASCQACMQHSLQVREVVVVEEGGCQACVQHSLQVREVVVVEEAGCQACGKLSPGERVC
jgi:hypothetical protein